MSQSPIQAVAIFTRHWERPGVGVYHSRYQGFAATPHAHAEAQLLVPLSGRMHLVAGPQVHVLGPEGAAWLPPGVPHGFIHVDGQLEFLAVETQALPGVLAEAGSARPLVARATGLWHAARALAHELEGATDDALVQGLLEVLWRYLARAAGADAPAVPAGSREVRVVVEAILADYASDLRVPDLAALVGLGARQLERRFQAELGKSPKRLLTEVRMRAAEALIRDTDRPIARIALEVGFQNPAHFAATFREATGHLPRALRGSSAS